MGNSFEIKTICIILQLILQDFFQKYISLTIVIFIVKAIRHRSNY